MRPTSLAVAATFMAFLLVGCQERKTETPSSVSHVEPQPTNTSRSPQGDNLPLVLYSDHMRHPSAYVPVTRRDVCSLTNPAAPTYEGSVAYQPLGLWKYEIEGEPSMARGHWVRVATPRPASIIGCNQPVPFERLVGVASLEDGTYWIVANVNGHHQSSFVFAGETRCSDVKIGPTPSGMVATCVLGRQGARAQFVPDPAALQP